MMHPDYRMRPSAVQLLNHPAICKRERMRVWELRFKRAFAAPKKLIAFFISIFANIIFITSYPFKMLQQKFIGKREVGTPPHVVNGKNLPVSEWDASFSDDDVFDTSAFSQNQHSGFSDSSSSSGGKFASNEFSFRNDCR